MKKFKIKFKGLTEDKYKFSFEINDSFFENFEESLIKKGELHSEVELIIYKDIFKLNIYIKGKVQVQCDRCIDYFYLPIKSKNELFVETGDKNSDLSDVDNKITISKNEEEIVLDKHFYDYIHLSLPYKKIHPKDKKGKSTCNIKMIEKINEHSSKNKREELDPRWDVLKKLYN